MDIETKIALLRKATGRLAAQVDALILAADYPSVTLLQKEAIDLKAWLEELEAEKGDD